MAKGTGLSRNAAAALSYVLGPVTGIIFFLLEKDEYVRFHASQSIAVFGFFWILSMLLPFTIIFIFFIPLVGIFSFVLWIVCIIKAYNGEKWEVPVLGSFRKIVLDIAAKKD